MKIKHLLLVLSSSVVMFFSTGCVVTALTGMPPPAGIDITNNVANTTMRVSSSRGRDLSQLSNFSQGVPTGETVRIPICNVPLGSYYTVLVKFYDENGNYLGINQEQFFISFDYSGRYSQSWVVYGYRPPNNQR